MASAADALQLQQLPLSARSWRWHGPVYLADAIKVTCLKREGATPLAALVRPSPRRRLLCLSRTCTVSPVSARETE